MLFYFFCINKSDCENIERQEAFEQEGEKTNYINQVNQICHCKSANIQIGDSNTSNITALNIHVNYKFVAILS